MLTALSSIPADMDFNVPILIKNNIIVTRPSTTHVIKLGEPINVKMSFPSKEHIESK